MSKPLYLISISEDYFKNNIDDWYLLDYKEKQEARHDLIEKINIFLEGAKNSKSPFKLYKITDTNNIELHGIKIISLEQKKSEAATSDS